MRRLVILVACLTTLAYLPAAAQGDADARNYRLSMDKLRKLVEVQRDFADARKSNPEVYARMNEETEAAMEQHGGSLTASQRIALMERHPEIEKVLTDAGWNARDYTLTYEAATVAGSGAPPSTEAEKANATLLQQNAAQSQKLMQELGRLNEEMGDAEDSE